MRALFAAIAIALFPVPGMSADLNSADRFSDEAYFESEESPSWWQLWGSAALGFEYYNDNFPGDEYSGANTSGSIILKAPSGFNAKLTLGFEALEGGSQAGFANADLFYTSPGFALGVTGGTFADTENFESAWATVHAAKFFSHFDIGGYAEVDGYRVGDPIYAVGAWLKAYATQDTLLAASYEYDWNNDGVSVHFLDLHAEHRFTGTGFGAYVDAERGWTDWGFKSWDVFGGVRFYFDGDNETLQGYQRGANPFYWGCCW